MTDSSSDSEWEDVNSTQGDVPPEDLLPLLEADDDENVEMMMPSRLFAQAIGLRLAAKPDEITVPSKIRVRKAPGGGLNRLWQNAGDRDRVANDFILGTPVIRKCRFCHASVLDCEYSSNLCCGKKGAQILKNQHWPRFTSRYKRAAINMRRNDKNFSRNCMSTNRSFATAKLVVDSVAPEHRASVYKPFKNGWNIRQAGNVVLAGRSYVMPLENNRVVMPAVQMNTAQNGTTSRSDDNFDTAMMGRAMAKEKENFVDSGNYAAYTPIPGDFPPITTAATPEHPPPDDIQIEFRDHATNVTRMGEAVGLSTVGPDYCVAPHVTAALPAGSRIRPLDHYEPHAYPLLLPNGIGGYSTRARFKGRREGAGDQLHLTAFYRRVLYQRADDLAMFPRVAELLYIDQCNRIAANMLDQQVNIDSITQAYLKRVIRMNEYRNARGFQNMGRYWQIPTCVPGSPAYIKKKQDDGMALIAKYGDPTFFITMTTNKHWPEVKALKERYQAKDDPAEAHPLITVRAFRMRLQALEAALRDGYLFGVEPSYIQRCVEFQLRGLSHAHIIVRLKGDQPQSSAAVGNFVSARLFYSEWCPNQLPRTDSECQCFAHKLTRLVSQFMVHKCIVGVCKNTRDEPCKKRFPYATSAENYISEDTGRWYYKRTEEDAYVVPYNPILLYLFECHLNVDCCTGPGSGRYIRKYQCKMADSTMIRLSNVGRDHVTAATRSSRAAKIMLEREVKEFFRTRVLSSSEAVTRLLNCTVHKLEPAVKVVYIHLPGDHSLAVQQRGDAEEGERLDVDSSSVLGSMLLRYFQRPRGPDFDNLTILDYFSNYDIDTSSEAARLRRPGPRRRRDTTNIRDQGMQVAPFNLRKCRPLRIKKRPTEACAYIVSIQPSKAELYCLRQLLVTTPARSFEDLKRDGSTRYRTFQDAAVARGLFCHDKEYQIALQTCVNSRMTNHEWDEHHVQRRLAVAMNPYWRILNLFISIITTCDDKQAGSRNSTVVTLFDLFWPYLLRNLPLGEDEQQGISAFDNTARKHEALRAIAAKLHPLRIDLQDIGLETPPPVFTNSSEFEASIVNRELNRYDRTAMQQEYDTLSRTLTHEQRDWVSEVSNAIGNDQPVRNNVFYLGGNAGCGKSTAIKALLNKVRLSDTIALPCAFMAGAACIMPGGDTLHRLFKLPVEKDKETNGAQPMRSSIKAHSSAHVILKHAKLIVIDEISMVSRRILECVDTTLRDVRNPDLPFGGVSVVLAGDFKQLTPVIKGATRLTTVASSVTSMDVFKNARKTVLRRQMRVQDADWNRLALAAGYGVPNCRPCPGCSHKASQNECRVCGGLTFTTAAVDEEERVEDGFFKLDVASLRHRKLLPHSCRVTCSKDEARRFAGTDGFIISSINNDVVAHNDTHVPTDHEVLRGVNTQPRSADDQHRESFRHLPQDIMDAYSGHDVPPTQLKLWVGARVTLLRNLNPSIGLYNGQHLIVRSISKFLVQVTIEDISGRYDPSVVHDIPRVTLSTTVCSLKIARKQFPLKLAYAMTVNRSQGQTIRSPFKVVIDATRDYFSHGHLYVALTRVQYASQVMLLLNPDSPSLSSVVYQTILNKSGDTFTAATSSGQQPLARQPADDVPTLGDNEDLPDDAGDANSDCDVEEFGYRALLEHYPEE